MKTSPFVKFAVVGFVFGMVFLGAFSPKTINADYEKEPVHVPKVVKKTKIVVTAYSSSWDETTGIPGKPGLITASGKPVADGVVAYNHLPFGTKLRITNIPELEDKILVVQDRTAKGRKNLDIWMTSKQKALKFGWAVAEVEILED